MCSLRPARAAVSRAHPKISLLLHYLQGARELIGGLLKARDIKCRLVLEQAAAGAGYPDAEQNARIGQPDWHRIGHDVLLDLPVANGVPTRACFFEFGEVGGNVSRGK